MNEISSLITAVYFVVGVLVIRQIFKRNLMLRCANCKSIGTLQMIDEGELEEPLVLDDTVLDTEQIVVTNQFEKAYKCRKCGHITPIS